MIVVISMFGMWLLLVLLLIFIEISTSNLTTIWFIISGILTLILSCFPSVTLEVQFVVFVIGGVLLLFATRPFLKKFLKKKTVKTNLDRVIGMTGVVTEPILKNKIGEVKVDGKRWSAIADKKIEIDKTVRVLEIDGVKIKVEEVNE